MSRELQAKPIAPGHSNEREETKHRLAQWLRKPLFAMCVIFTITLIPKLVFIQTVILPQDKELGKDALLYAQCAENIWKGGTFGRTANEPIAFIPILYPLFLSPFIGLSGDLNPAVVLYVQSVMAALGGVMAYTLGRRLHGDLAGWFAGLFFASYVPMMKYPGYFLTETLAVVGMILALLLADFLLSAKTTRGAYVFSFFCGAAFAASALTRAIAFPLISITFTVFLVVAGKSWRRAASAIAVGCLGFVLVYSPWVVRNYVTFDRLIILPDVGNTVVTRPYYVAEFVRNGDSYLDAETKYKALREEDKLRTPHVKFLSRTYLSHCIIRLGIMTGTHPSLELPWPFAGHHVYVPRPILIFNYLWGPVVWFCTLLAAAWAIYHWNLRVLHVIMQPMALIVMYGILHAVPRYQVVSYASFSIAAGIGLSLLFQQAGRSIRRLPAS